MAGKKRYNKIAFQKRIIRTDVIVKPHAMRRYCERILGGLPECPEDEFSTKISEEIVTLMKSGRFFALTSEHDALIIKTGFKNEFGELIFVYFLLRFKDRNSEIEIVTVFNREIAEGHYIAKGKWIVFPRKKSKRQRREELAADCDDKE
jgi:predicted DNA-binding protein (MmcQ/YjbR family)